MATSYWDQRVTQADDLVARAEELAESEPGTEPARAAARQAVQAADALARDRGTAADLRRLGQALWRQASASQVSGPEPVEGCGRVTGPRHGRGPEAAGPGPVAQVVLVSGDPAAALAPARRCWALTERALASVPPGSPEWGETVGEAVQRLGVIIARAEQRTRPPRRRPGRLRGLPGAAVHRGSSGGPRVRQAQARLARSST